MARRNREEIEDDAPETAMVIGPVRLAFPHLDKPAKRAIDSDKMTYQAVALLPPDVPIKPLNKLLKKRCNKY